MTANQVLKILAAACRVAGSQQAWAEKHSLSAAYVSDVLSRRREPGEGILRALDIERVIVYRHRKARAAGIETGEGDATDHQADD